MYLIKKAHQSFFTTESDYLCLEVGSFLLANKRKEIFHSQHNGTPLLIFQIQSFR